MAAGNHVTVVGNVTVDPTLRFAPSGQAVATFGVAVNRKWMNRQTQEWEEAVSFFDVTCWGTLGENVAESVQKGTRVIVAGRLEQRSWETESGDKRSKVEVVADEVGPSLRWATATVVRNERSDGGQSATSRSAPPTTSTYDDEEPFRVDAGEWMPGMWGHYPERMLP